MVEERGEVCVLYLHAYTRVCTHMAVILSAAPVTCILLLMPSLPLHTPTHQKTQVSLLAFFFLLAGLGENL